MKGVVRIEITAILSLSLSLFLVPLDSRFQFNATPFAPLKLDRFFVSFARSFVRAARFFDPVKRDWKLCSFVGSFSWCTPVVGWQFREADSANEKLVRSDIGGEAPRQRAVK